MAGTYRRPQPSHPDSENSDEDDPPQHLSYQHLNHSQNINNGFSPSNVDTAPVRDYVDGSIKRIRMKNFVTYDEADFEPGPKLNVVIGPNGTGKSTIVCAIAIGLAGSPNLLGRAKALGDYVKRGADSGFVEITLHSSRGNIVIRRDIRKDNFSEFRVNNRVTALKEVQDTVKKLNVQIDNLCQFLPQEKVSEFAKLSKYELLLSTEKAVGSPELFETHMKLIKSRDREKELRLRIDEHTKHLNDLKAQNSSLEHDVLRFQEREKYLNRVKLLEKKKAWIVFEQTRQRAVALKTRMKELQEKLKKKEAEDAPHQADLKRLEKEQLYYQNQRQEFTSRLKTLDQERQKHVEDLDHLENDLESRQQDLANLNNRAEDRRRKRETVITEIKRFETQLASRNKESLQESLKKKNAEVNKINAELDELQRQILHEKEKLQERQQPIRALKQKLKELEDLRLQRLEVLRRADRDAFNAYTWIQEHKDLFRQEVLGPLCLEVRVKELLHARYLEQLCPRWVTSAFVCQNDADRSTLLSELYEKQRLKISVIFTKDDDRDQRPCDIRQLHQYGITSWVDEVVESHPTILLALKNNAGINITAIGNRETAERAETIFQRTDLNSLFAGETQYLRVRSRYDSSVNSTRVLSVKQARFFGNAGDGQREEAENKLKQLTQEIQKYEAAIPSLLKKQQDLGTLLAQAQKSVSEEQNMIKQYDSIAHRIESKKRELEMLEREEDVSQEKNRLELMIQKINKDRIRKTINLCKVLQKLTHTELSLDKILISRLENAKKLTQLKASEQERRRTLELLRREAAEADQSFQQEKRHVKQLYNETQKIAPMEEMKDELQEPPNTLQAIEDEIHAAKARADMYYQTNPKVIEDYERRKAEIEKLNSKVEDEELELAHSAEKIEEMKTNWLGPLKKLVGRIDQSFKKNFQRLNCKGEVRLVTDTDYDKYALEILVSFRKEESNLSVLNSHTQSGGERSVATMIFLISLQDLTPCPFRLVDEINQGMDPLNERMIFSIIVESACRPNLPQYFLITPKLLPDLDFTPSMTVLCIFNGPWQIPQSDWALKNSGE